MFARNGSRQQRSRESGVSLYIIAAAMVVILGMAGLAIDLGYLYVARSEAQRAADAAALAGATVFITSGCTAGASGISCSNATVQTAATNAAIAAGNQNLVGGQSPAIVAGDVSFNTANANNPRITVNAQRTAAHGNAMDTFFIKIFGTTTADVSVSATAEAYNPSGTTGGPPVCVSCVKPLLLPNCDPSRLVAGTDANANLNCPDGKNTYDSYFVNPSTGAIVHPGVTPTGVVGQVWDLHTRAAPSQWYSIAFNGDQSKSAWRTWLRTCNPSPITCGSTLDALDGNGVGPVGQGIDPLIHANGDGPNQGQDSIGSFDSTKVPPYTITGGNNNPNPALRGVSGITTSDSIVAVPIFDGHPLDPGKNTVTIVGHMQVFIQYVDHQGSDDIVRVTILNVTGCGTNSGTCGSTGGGGGSGSGGSVSGGGASPIPVRLIQN